MGAWSDFLKKCNIGWSLTFEETGYKRMRDLIGLMDACCDVVENPRFAPKDGQTFCNAAVSYIAVKVYGNHELEDMTADEIMEHVANSLDYSEVEMGNAQQLANQGSFIFAIASSQELDQEHGHVVVIRPGRMKESGKWGMAPAIVNVGSECFISRAKRGPLIGQPVGLNEAFIPRPRIYVWRPSL